MQHLQSFHLVQCTHCFIFIGMSWFLDPISDKRLNTSWFNPSSYILVFGDIVDAIILFVLFFLHENNVDRYIFELIIQDIYWFVLLHLAQSHQVWQQHLTLSEYKNVNFCCCYHLLPLQLCVLIPFISLNLHFEILLLPKIGCQLILSVVAHCLLYCAINSNKGKFW